MSKFDYDKEVEAIRAFTRGEMRFYNTVADKVSLLVDLYDIDKYPGNWYSRRRNPFDAKKITLL